MSSSNQHSFPLQFVIALCSWLCDLFAESTAKQQQQRLINNESRRVKCKGNGTWRWNSRNLGDETTAKHFKILRGIARNKIVKLSSLVSCQLLRHCVVLPFHSLRNQQWRAFFFDWVKKNDCGRERSSHWSFNVKTLKFSSLAIPTKHHQQQHQQRDE